MATGRAQSGGTPRGGTAARTRSTRNRRRKDPSALRVWLGRLLILALVVAIAGALAAVGAFGYYSRDLPTVATLRDYRPPQTSRIVDRNGATISEIFTERRTVVPLDRVPRVLVLSVLAAEDADFYRHQGLDYPGILRAVARDVLSGRPAQGASTITQQIVKILLLSPERTLSRKIRELILARRLEQELTKDEILHLYLNHVNFGHGRYGVQEAAQHYFGKNVEDLDLAESSLIAGIPQAPARLSPRTQPEAARRRQRFVLGQLARKRAEYWPDLTEEAIRTARDQELTLVERGDEGERAPEVASIARRILAETLDEERFARGGYTVHTSVDLRLQEAARATLRRHLEAVDERHERRGPLKRARRPARGEGPEFLREGRTYEGRVTAVDDGEGLLSVTVGKHSVVVPLEEGNRYNPRGLPPSEFAAIGARVHVSLTAPPRDGAPIMAMLELGPQGAVVVIDPRTRHVLALVGAYDATAGFNRAVDGLRQPGSTFKPIVYALGIKSRRFTPASLVLDAPAVYDDWQPQNYEQWRHEGPVRLRTALARSINMVAVRVIEELTPPETVQFARGLGITAELEPGLGLALGASEVRPVELVNAYATFAANGRWAPYQLVTRIVGPDGNNVPLPASPPPRQVLSAAEAYVVTSMLTSVVTEGTGGKAQELGWPVAGKTGTSNQSRDAWFVGYAADMVAGVWVGFDDNRPLGRRENGGRTALPIWIDVMRAARGERAGVPFAQPDGVVAAVIDPETGLLAYEGMETPLTEIFVAGTEPTEEARPPDVAAPDTFLMEQFGTAEDPPEPEEPPEHHEAPEP